MAHFGSYQTIPGLLAGADLSSSQNKLVKMASTAGQVIVATSATSKVVGVLMNDPASGEAAEVAFSGIAKVLAGSVTAGTFVRPNTTGQATDADGTDDNRIVGYAIEAGTAGQLIRIVLGCSNV